MGANTDRTGVFVSCVTDEEKLVIVGGGSVELYGECISKYGNCVQDLVEETHGKS